MRSLAEVVRGADPTPEQAASVARATDAVALWDAGGCDHWDVRRRSTGRDRWEALRFAPDAAARDRLLRCLDALIATDVTDREGFFYATRMGTFSTAEIRAAGGAIGKEGGAVVVRFPGNRGVS